MMTDRGANSEDDVDRLLAEIEAMLRRLTDFAIAAGRHGDSDPPSSETVRRLRDVLDHLLQALDAADSPRTSE